MHFQRRALVPSFWSRARRRRSISSRTGRGTGRHPQTSACSRCQRTRSSREAPVPKRCPWCHSRFMLTKLTPAVGACRSHPRQARDCHPFREGARAVPRLPPFRAVPRVLITRRGPGILAAGDETWFSCRQGRWRRKAGTTRGRKRRGSYGRQGDPGRNIRRSVARPRHVGPRGPSRRRRGAGVASGPASSTTPGRADHCPRTVARRAYGLPGQAMCRLRPQGADLDATRYLCLRPVLAAASCPHG